MRRETPHRTADQLVTGYFHESANYSVWRTHGTEDYLLILTLSGAGRFGHPDGEILTAPGDITLVRSGTPHDYATARGASGWEILWTHFLPRPHWRDWLNWPEPAPGVLHLSLGDTRSSAETALWNMHRQATGAQPRRTEFAMNALEEALLWCDVANPLRTVARRDPRVQAAMQYLLENLRHPVSLAELAQVAGLSVSRLSHLFREQIGQTPQQFVEQERLTRARQLLSLTGRTVAAIAEEVGFENPFYFTLRFKKQTGYSPREWRHRED
jgi:AraC family transcriptional regulator of arabinose operon